MFIRKGIQQNNLLKKFYRLCWVKKWDAKGPNKNHNEKKLSNFSPFKNLFNTSWTDSVYFRLCVNEIVWVWIRTFYINRKTRLKYFCVFRKGQEMKRCLIRKNLSLLSHFSFFFFAPNSMNWNIHSLLVELVIIIIIIRLGWSMKCEVDKDEEKGRNYSLWVLVSEDRFFISESVCTKRTTKQTLIYFQ